MDQRQQRTVTMSERVLLFLEREKVAPEPPLLTQKQRELTESLARLQKLQAQQTPQRQARVRTLSQRLRRERMIPIARLMKRLLAFAPGVERVLRVPHARADALTVATAALEMAKFIEPHMQLLASAGVSPTTAAELRAEAEKLAETLRGADENRERRGRVTREIAAEMKSAMAIIGVIDGMMLVHFARQPEMLQHWKHQRRVGKRMGRPPQKKKSARPLTS
jgi:hypothetical protein